MEKGNLFENIDSPDLTNEFIQKIFESGDTYIERIVSKTHKTSDGEWLDQELNEWVILLQGSAVLSYKDGGKIYLTKGDYTFIPSHRLHRVEQTSNEPECIWLAFFFR